MSKSHPPALKLKVALASITGQPTTDICRQYEVAESLVHKWKKLLKEQSVIIFQDSNRTRANNNDKIDKLHQVIGKLTIELEF